MFMRLFLDFGAAMVPLWCRYGAAMVPLLEDK
jgi:hypothetical protein